MTYLVEIIIYFSVILKKVQIMTMKMIIKNLMICLKAKKIMRVIMRIKMISRMVKIRKKV